MAASSTDTCSSDRVAGSIVVIAELLPVHLAETLEPADLDLAALVLGLERAQRGFVLEVVALLAEVGAEQRRLRDVHVAVAHDLGELAVEEREQQRADVRAVDVGVGHQHDLVVAELGEVELLADAGADRGDERLDLLVLAACGRVRARSTLRIFPRIGRIAWNSGLRARLAGPPALSPSTMNSSHCCGVLRRAVGELAGHAPTTRAATCGASRSRAWRAATRALAAWLALPTACRASVGCSSSQSAELLVGGLLDQRAHLGVAELRLGLALELRVAQLHRHDRGEPLADVLAEEVGVLLLEEVLRLGVAVHHVGEGLLEALLVHPALGGGDVVGERVDALVEAGVPLHRDVDLVVVAGVGVRERPA